MYKILSFCIGQSLCPSYLRDGFC